jgi:hypothetical protein
LLRDASNIPLGGKKKMRTTIWISCLALSLVLCVNAVAAEQERAKDAAAPAGAEAAQPPPNPFEKRPPNPFDKKPDPWLGVYHGDDMALELKPDAANAKGYAGTIAMTGMSCPFTAVREGDTLKGTFKFKGFDYSFEAQLLNGALTLKTGQSVYRLQKQSPTPTAAPGSVPGHAPAPGNPPASQGPPASTPARSPIDRTPPAKDVAQLLGLPTIGGGQGDINPPAARWSAVSYAGHFQFRYPEPWSRHIGPNGVGLVPDDAVRDQAGGPLDMLLVARDPIAESREAGDEAVLAFFDRYVATRFPNMKRDGRVERVDALLGHGVAIPYAGALPFGTEARITIYAAIDGDACAYLVHLSPAARAAARTPAARAVFASFGWDIAPRDQRLVGVWSGRPASTPREGAEPIMERWRFNADGTCSFEAINPAIAAAPGGAAATVAAKSRLGRWSTLRGQLVVTWHDGDASLIAYTLSPGQPRPQSLSLSVNGGIAMTYHPE